MFSQELNLDSIPIGCILGFAKHLMQSNMPEEFVECDGSIINIDDSPLNGIMTPDLNTTNRFLRGSTSGNNTGGSETHRHRIRFSNDTNAGSSSGFNRNPGQLKHNTDYYTTYSNHLPPYYNVVWVLKVK